MKDHVRTLASISRYPVSVVPNAGLPDEDGHYLETPEKFSRVIQGYVEAGWVNVIGGCCGTTPAHIRKLSEIATDPKIRTPVEMRQSRVSGIEPLVFEEEGRPYIVGERTNVIGSRAFKRLIVEDKFEEAAEIARGQVKAGAHLIDVCLANPDRDEKLDMVRFLEKAVRLVKIPFVIDSQDPTTIEAAFRLVQGKCVLNSVNLEDGEKIFEELLPLVQRYGASVVVGCIMGEMAVTAEAKLAVAKESYSILTKKYGIPEEDIIWDPLVFPCGTGDKNYFGSGRETIEGIRAIKTEFPRTRTILGISNVSFGLPSAGREALNSVFLYHCTKAGLDMAIINSQKLVRFAGLTDEEKKLSDDLLWYNTKDGNDPVAKFAAYYRGKKTETKTIDRSKLSVEKKLEINIVEGTKEFLEENLNEALKKYDPLGVINGPLMAGMTIVGRMFNDNELIVAEVLQSAESMKASVSFLEKFMDKAETVLKGKLLLATVKGDVHDIGKNLVEIILSNNGYKVVNLGIKCPPEKLIEAFRKESPDFIGLSGLLVKSAQQMVITARDLKAEGIDAPILVGGAALTESFTATKVATEYAGHVLYCKDAMTGLAVAQRLVDKDEDWLKEQAERREKIRARKAAPVSPPTPAQKTYLISHENTPPMPPHLDRIIVSVELKKIWEYLNITMLYGKHMGLKGAVKKLLEDNDPKAVKLKNGIERLKTKIIAESLMKARGVYQFFRARAEGDHVVILDPGGAEIERFRFPRQSTGEGLSLSDFVSPRFDYVALFTVTCGGGISTLARDLLDKGEYFNSHGLSALALESAEAFAELMHRDIREEWGIRDAANLGVDDVLKAKYHGLRVSFGYPACPRLEDQAKLWNLLKPDEAIGVKLSEEYMMEPEASVSALVFHHPRAKYFQVSAGDLEHFEKTLVS